MKILKFNAIWCSGCIVMKKIMKQIEEEYKTIEIDGTPSGWEPSMKIAQGIANNDPRVFPKWSMHEIAMDDYALFAAYDDQYLYLMWEMTNMSDVVADADFPISTGTGTPATGNGNGNPPRVKKPSNSKRYQCPCCKAIVRATSFVNIICADCNVPFVLTTK